MKEPSHEQTIQELRALLFGEGPYARSGAPEPELLGGLSSALPEAVLEEAIRAVAGIGFMFEDDRLRTLAALLPRFPDSGQDAVLARMAVRFPEIISSLPERLLARVLAAVRAMEEVLGRAEALARLAGRLGQPTGQKILLEEATAAARAPGWDDYKRRALVELIPYLSPPFPEGFVEELLAVARTMDQGENRAAALTGLIPFLFGTAKEETALEALVAARAIEWLPTRIRALVKLRPHLPESLRGDVLQEALTAARERPYDIDRARALADIARQLEEPLQSQLRREIQALDLPDLGGQDFFDLVPYLSEDQVARFFRTLQDYHVEELAGRLSRLAPQLSERMLSEALSVAARESLSEKSRARLTIALAPYLPQELALAAAARTIERCGLQIDPRIAAGVPEAKVEEPWWTYRTLLSLRPRLPEDHPLRSTPVLQPFSDERILYLLDQLPIEKRESLFRDVTRRIEAYYGGGAGPPKMDEEASGAEKEYEVPEPAATPVSPAEAVREAMMHEASAKLRHRIPPPHECVVNTGFASREEPETPVDRMAPLLCGRDYYFWLEVGRKIMGAIDALPASLPVELLPAEARLKVALFSFDGEIAITPGKDLGEIQIQADGSAAVVRAVDEPEGLKDKALLKRRLFFPVTMPARPGVFGLRCSIYYKQVLVQSHLVRVEVLPSFRFLVRRLSERVPRLFPGRGPGPALETLVDYTLSNTLRADRLSRLDSHRLSIMLNDNGDGTHGFRFLGADEGDEFKGDASLSGQELQDLIDQARGALRQAAWGDPGPWQNRPYLYEGPRDPERLRRDLVLFAKKGYRFYNGLVNRLAGGRSQDRRAIRREVQKLERLMAKPGLVQLGSRESARHIVPAAMIYDYAFDTTLPPEDYTLCPTFATALEKNLPLAETECFAGACPSRGKDSVVCPSGFWGYRHKIGMPVSIGGALSDAAVEIRYHGLPELAVAVSTDPALVRRPGHEQALRTLGQSLGWQYADTREKALDMMKRASAHLLYFYCHGGVADNVPYIQVGSLSERGITSDLLRSKNIFWETTQPLVFINGCHTTALEPERAFDLVTGFVETANAAGVIGTEITIFEPLACTFSEECLRHFLNGVPIGESVRLARLKLLEDGNPLGLAYIPFVLASLSMTKA